jgi:hypothetical protein
MIKETAGLISEKLRESAIFYANTRRQIVIIETTAYAASCHAIV